ncbi:MAG: head GIN domain-containing protein [Polaribacter sp.]
MKSITKQIVFFLSMTLMLSSCNMNMLNSVNGNKNVEVADRTVAEDFTKIKVSTGLDLYLSQGTENKITLEADENLHEIIFTKIENGELKIYSDKNIWNAKAKKVYLTVKGLTSIVATSGSNVYTEEELSVENINIVSTSGADIDLNLNANSVISTATSGSDIKLNGTTIQHTCSATSGASIEAYDLTSENVTVNVTSGADINIYASVSLEARATSGGDIDFKGNPKNVKKSSTSGGSISAK